MNKKMIDELNGYLSNIGVMYIKLHNLHWNVVGVNFKVIHEYLETLYDGYSTTLDEVAEVLKTEKIYPFASIKDYLNNATIKELESKEYSESEVLDIVYKDSLIIKNQLELIRELAQQEDNYVIISISEDQLSNLNKTIWFLTSMRK